MSSNGKSLDEVFTRRIADLHEAVKASADSMETTGKSKWLELYSDKDGPDGRVLNGLDPEEFTKAFDREELNKAYIDLAQSDDKPSYRDAQVTKVQLDFLAGMERDLRMRYRPRTRMLAHGLARMKSHGLPDGPVGGGILNFVKILADKRT